MYLSGDKVILCVCEQVHQTLRQCWLTAQQNWDRRWNWLVKSQDLLNPSWPGLKVSVVLGCSGILLVVVALLLGQVRTLLVYMIVQTAELWKLTLTTSLSRTLMVPALLSWITWLLMTLASTCASPPVLQETPAPWARLQYRVGTRTRFLVFILQSTSKTYPFFFCFCSTATLCPQVEKRFLDRTGGCSVHLHDTKCPTSKNKVLIEMLEFCHFSLQKCASLYFNWTLLPLLRWFKDSKLLTDQEKYQTYSEPRSGVVVFVIKNPGEKDLGRYECEVQYCRRNTWFL